VYDTPIYNGLVSTDESLGAAPAFASLQAEISPFATSLTGNPTAFHDHPTQLSSPMLNLGTPLLYRSPAPISLANGPDIGNFTFDYHVFDENMFQDG
jgi:hypothetical protein